jgi:hypothetical protein
MKQTLNKSDGPSTKGWREIIKEIVTPYHLGAIACLICLSLAIYTITTTKDDRVRGGAAMGGIIGLIAIMGGTGYLIHKETEARRLRDDADERRRRITAAEKEAVAVNLGILGDSVAADVFDAIKGTLIFNQDSEEERVDLFASIVSATGRPRPGESAKVAEFRKSLSAGLLDRIPNRPPEFRRKVKAILAEADTS